MDVEDDTWERFEPSTVFDEEADLESEARLLLFDRWERSVAFVGFVEAVLDSAS
jgi:hypothetical protein